MLARGNCVLLVSCSWYYNGAVPYVYSTAGNTHWCYMMSTTIAIWLDSLAQSSHTGLRQRSHLWAVGIYNLWHKQVHCHHTYNTNIRFNPSFVMLQNLTLRRLIHFHMYFIYLINLFLQLVSFNSLTPLASHRFHVIFLVCMVTDNLAAFFRYICCGGSHARLGNRCLVTIVFPNGWSSRVCCLSKVKKAVNTLVWCGMSSR